MSASDNDIWETSTSTTYDNVLMMVDNGNETVVYGRSVTLSRAFPLLIECGFQPQVLFTFADDDTIRIPYLTMDESLEELEDTNEALKNLKRYPVDVWAWKIHSTTTIEPFNVPAGLEKAPILVASEEDGSAYVFGQVSDINTIINTCVAFDIDIQEANDGTEVVGFKVEECYFWQVTDIIENAGFPLLDANPS